jgi:Flp pilus assembly protein TadD
MKPLLAILALVFSSTMLQAKSNVEAPKKPGAQSEAMAGLKLNAKQAAELEAAVAKNPDDLSARTKLLGYYCTSRHTSDDAKAANRKHVLWIIKNQPEAEIAGTPFCQIDASSDPDGYHEAKQLWLAAMHAQPKNSTILGHAAQFVFLHDRALAEDLLKQVRQLEPKEPKWSDQLGHLYAMKDSKEGAKQALAEYEKAQSADTVEETKFYRLDNLAKSALAAGEIEKASLYAQQLLKAGEKHPKDWNYGNSIHHGNNVLGQIALRKGDVKEADEFLLKAGQTPGSPQLNSFGPNMSLAKELLEAGEKDTVLQYFALCGKFWKSGAERLDDWSKEVKAGQVPQFGANLVY